MGIFKNATFKILTIGILLLIAFGSIFIFGPNNKLEDITEELADQTFEHFIDLPEGSINIDLTPNKK